MRYWGSSASTSVPAAVAALSAAGCVPVSICNGGVFGEGLHAESYPLVAFYCPDYATRSLLDICERLPVSRTRDVVFSYSQGKAKPRGSSSSGHSNVRLVAHPWKA